MKKYFIIAAIGFGIFCFAPKSQAAYLYYRTITVTTTASVASGTNLNFPMLVSSTFASWETSSTSGGAGHVQNLCTAPNDGGTIQEPCDFVFATSTANCGTANLNFETEKYTSSTGALIDWVNVPSVSTGTIIYACYDSTAITTDQSNPSATWNSSYIGVWHFTNGTTLNASDSTANANNGTISGETATTTCEISTGCAYLKGTHYIQVTPIKGGIGVNATQTISMWFDDPTFNGNQNIYTMENATTSANAGNDFTDQSGANDFALGDQGGCCYIEIDASTTPGLPTINTWHYAVVTYNGTGHKFTLYMDGAFSTSTTATAQSGTSTNIYFSTYDGSDQPWTGKMEEARYLNVALTPSWIATEYNDQSSPSTFYAVGSETVLTIPTPTITSASTTINSNGTQSGNTITITGTNFGTVATSSAATCSGATGTGCVEFIVGGTATVASSSISSWTNTTITFTVSSTLASNGGVSALQVWAAGASSTGYTYYIYPNITGMVSIGTNAARTYNASDTDGLIYLQGDHFGTAGTSTILGLLATQNASAAGPCSTGGYTSTSACFQVPSTIPSSTYSGTVIITRTSDNAQATTSLSLYPRITTSSPTSGAEGTVIQLLGDHFCGPSGTCPVTPNRSSTTNNVKFGNSTSSDAGFMALSGGSGACNGSGAAWTNGEICVKIATGTPVGSASETVTSNGNLSNIFAFTSTAPPTPGTPAAPTYTSITSSTLTVNWGVSSNSDYYQVQRATSSQVYALLTPTTTALTFNDLGLTANSTYYYQVRGTNTGGNGSWSASSSALTVPDVPGTPTYTNVSTSSVTVSWTAPTNGASFYVLQRATSSQVYALVTTTSALTYSNSGLSLGGTYYYHVLGANASGTEAPICPSAKMVI